MAASMSAPRTNPASTRSVWALSFAVWTIVALFLSQKWYLFWRDQGRCLACRHSLAYSLGSCYIHALATPLLMSLGWRYRLERRRWARPLFLQLLISVPASAATVAAGRPLAQGLEGA